MAGIICPLNENRVNWSAKICGGIVPPLPLWQRRPCNNSGFDMTTGMPMVLWSMTCFPLFFTPEIHESLSIFLAKIDRTFAKMNWFPIHLLHWHYWVKTIMKLHLKFDTTNLVSQKQFCKCSLRLDISTSYGQIKLLVAPIFVHLGAGNWDPMTVSYGHLE